MRNRTHQIDYVTKSKASDISGRSLDREVSSKVWWTVRVKIGSTIWWELESKIRDAMESA